MIRRFWPYLLWFSCVAIGLLLMPIGNSMSPGITRNVVGYAFVVLFGGGLGFGGLYVGYHLRKIIRKIVWGADD
jgi:hypothetical protein